MATDAFEEFIAPARARPQVWRLLVGTGVALAIYVAFIAAMFFGLWLAMGAADTGAWMAEVLEAEAPLATLFLLATFTGMALAAVGAAALLHRRGPATLFGPRGRTIRDFFVAGGIVAAVLGASSLMWLSRFDPVPNLEPSVWLSLLPLALLGVLIQTGAEEMLFRGYLQQQLAARFRSPLIWLVLPSVLFGLVHLDPAGAGGNAWLIVVAAGIFGLVAADLTAVTGSIGAAWGFHFVNNCVALLVIATQGTIPGLALYQTPYAVDDAGVIRGLIVTDILAIALAWGLVRLALRRR